MLRRICAIGTSSSDWLISSPPVFQRLVHNVEFSESEPVASEEITRALKKSRMTFKTGHSCLRTTCPRFTHSKLKLDKLDQLYINNTTGYFVCMSCKSSGPWKKLSENIQVLKEAAKSGNASKLQKCFKDYKAPSTELETGDDSLSDLTHVQGYSLVPTEETNIDTILELLGMAGLKLNTLLEYHVRVSEDEAGLVFPCFDIDMNWHCAKIVSVTDSSTHTETIPKFTYDGIFGWHLARAKKNIVITSSEADAMAVFQETKTAAIALPRGTSALPQQTLPFLESFNKITIWFENTTSAFENAKSFARKLGTSRTYIVRPESRAFGPLKALQRHKNLKKILEKSISLEHEQIITFAHHREDVKHELQFSKNVAGVQWTKFHGLNDIVKGHRRGELTVFTGSTGSGKTTFLSDYSLDLCVNGVNTLWGSFEINNIRLMKLMLQQFAMKNLSKHIDEYDKHADAFNLLPLYFMNYHGHEDVKNVIDTMSHAVYVYDISHVVIDNLQFMMGAQDAIDRFTRQDQIISAFRRFATKMNCHVTVVIHPRKEDNGALSTNSIFGGGKASQEADNILILQMTGVPGSTRCQKYLQVTKNRFDGSLGSLFLSFNKECKSFAVESEAQADSFDKPAQQKADTCHRTNPTLSRVIEKTRTLDW